MRKPVLVVIAIVVAFLSLIVAYTLTSPARSDRGSSSTRSH